MSGVVSLVSFTPNPEDVIVQAGRVCHDSIDANGRLMEHFIKRLIRMGHESVLEHASATFELSGVSRSLTHQLVRHRLVSYSQRSQRYVEESGFDFVIPPTIADDEKARLRFFETMGLLTEAYQDLIDLGIPKQDARFVLPNACHTTIVVTANFRQWRHMIALRGSKHAQWEIRECFKIILRELRAIAPNCFYDFKIIEEVVVQTPVGW